MKFATTTWFSPDVKLAPALELIAAKGYQTVEIAGTRENLKIDSGEIKGILRNLSLDLSCISIGLPFALDPIRLNLHSQPFDIRSRSLEYVFECINYASKAGAKFVYVCSLVGEQPGQSRYDAITFLKESLSKCVEYGEKLGVLVALEHFPLGLCPSIEDAQRLVSDVQGVGLVFDVGHEALCRRPVGLPIHDSKLILDVHVNNNDGVNDRHWAPEKGVIQAAEYIDTIKQLQSIGYDRNFTIELLNIHGSLDLPSSKSLIDFLGF